MTENTTYKSLPDISAEITPEHIYLSRRKFLKAMGLFGASAVLAACAPALTESKDSNNSSFPAYPASIGDTNEPTGTPKSSTSDELGDPLNSFEEITNYNNYYEFSIKKERVADLAEDFKTSPWDVEVYGLVNNPKTFGIEDLLSMFPQEERVYRLRCVEAWSMVVPWQGFTLSSLLKEVDPTSSAKYVRFETLLDPEQMPGVSTPFYPWPYQEGLRLDEAMHDLTILATGLYGKPMPNQNGAPIRLVVPWKYGFKSIKSIVRIELVDYEPETMWSTIAPHEYGFYANVNPEVKHPRWSQASERRIGESGRRRTLMFNGYDQQVAHMYEGMDLSEYY